MSTYIAVFAMVLAYVALVAAYIALRTLARVRRSTAILTKGATGSDSLLDVVERTGAETAVLADEVAVLRALAERTSALLAESAAAPPPAKGPQDDTVNGALRNVSLVRYDAFTEMSGRLSFSLALLDGGADGVVISAIAAPTDTRVYAKGVAGGKGEQELSPEERQAVTSAMRTRHGRGGLLGRKAG